MNREFKIVDIQRYRYLRGRGILQDALMVGELAERRGCRLTDLDSLPISRRIINALRKAGFTSAEPAQVFFYLDGKVAGVGAIGQRRFEEAYRNLPPKKNRLYEIF